MINLIPKIEATKYFDFILPESIIFIMLNMDNEVH